MNKILIIIQREYLIRVRTKAFILSTLLTPLGLGLLMLIPLLAAFNIEKEFTVVHVIDETGSGIQDRLLTKGDGEMQFKPSAGDLEYYKSNLKPGEVLLRIPEAVISRGGSDRVNLYYSDRISLQVKEDIRRKLNDAYFHVQLAKMQIAEEQFELVRKKLDVTEESIVAQESAETSTEVAAAVGYVMGFVIYIMLIMYGMYVMRGVIEEKSSRILEVMVSSVRPFQLMMGKIVGIGLVAITQYLIWIFLSVVLLIVIGMAFQPDAATVQSMNQAGDPEQMEEMSQKVSQVLEAINLKTVSLFLFYFIGGFLMYGSLFAAVGSTVDQEADAQQFTFIVMIPLIIPMLVLSNIIQNPAGNLAVLFSIFPLFSPTIMMVRQAAMDVPWYETASSMVFLLLGFTGAVWLAGRIYRTGILMYGKKVNLREILRWIRYK